MSPRRQKTYKSTKLEECTAMVLEGRESRHLIFLPEKGQTLDLWMTLTYFCW